MPIVRKRQLDGPATQESKAKRRKRWSLEEFSDIGYSEDHCHTLKRAIPDHLLQFQNELMVCIGSFLNGDGGILCYGAKPNGVVYGQHVSRKEEDVYKLCIDEVMKKMHPMVCPSRYRVSFVPVDMRSYRSSSYFVLEIRVSNGEPYLMYEDSRHEVYVRKGSSPYGPLKPCEIEELTVKQLWAKLKAERKLPPALVCSPLPSNEGNKATPVLSNQRRSIPGFSKHNPITISSSSSAEKERDTIKKDKNKRRSLREKSPLSDGEAPLPPLVTNKQPTTTSKQRVTTPLDAVKQSAPNINVPTNKPDNTQAAVTSAPVHPKAMVAKSTSNQVTPKAPAEVAVTRRITRSLSKLLSSAAATAAPPKQRSPPAAVNTTSKPVQSKAKTLKNKISSAFGVLKSRAKAATAKPLATALSQVHIPVLKTAKTPAPTSVSKTVQPAPSKCAPQSTPASQLKASVQPATVMSGGAPIQIPTTVKKACPSNPPPIIVNRATNHPPPVSKRVAPLPVAPTAPLAAHRDLPSAHSELEAARLARNLASQTCSSRPYNPYQQALPPPSSSSSYPYQTSTDSLYASHYSRPPPTQPHQAASYGGYYYDFPQKYRNAPKNPGTYMYYGGPSCERVVKYVNY